MWKKLDHVNVCKLVEVINDPNHDQVYLISEFVPGGTLLPDKRTVKPVTPPSLAAHFFRRCPVTRVWRNVFLCFGVNVIGKSLLSKYVRPAQYALG